MSFPHDSVERAVALATTEPAMADALRDLARAAAVGTGAGQVNAGAGMTGTNGGALPTTLNVNAGDTTIVVDPNDIKVGILKASNFTGPATPTFVLTLDGGGVPKWVAPAAVAASRAFGEIFGISGPAPGGGPDYAVAQVTDTPIPFPQPLKQSGGVTRINKNAAGVVGGPFNTLILPTTGRWLITCQVEVVEPCQIGVALAPLGGPAVVPFAIVANTVVGRASGTSQLIISTVISATATDAIQIWTTGVAGPVNIGVDSAPAGPPAGGVAAVIANFRAEFLAP